MTDMMTMTDIKITHTERVEFTSLYKDENPGCITVSMFNRHDGSHRTHINIAVSSMDTLITMDDDGLRAFAKALATAISHLDQVEVAA